MSFQNEPLVNCSFNSSSGERKAKEEKKIQKKMKRIPMIDDARLLLEVLQ